MTSEIAKQFADLGTKEVPQDAGTVKTAIIGLLQEYPGQWFPKRAFTGALKEMEGVASSDPAVHSALQKLAKAGVIEVDNGGGRKNFYRIPASKKSTKK